MPVNFVIPEQQQAPLMPGATSPGQSAHLEVSNMNKTQAAVNKIGGIRRRKIRRGGGGTIAIQRTDTSTMNVNPLLAKVAASNVNAQAAGEFDNKASVKGGSKRRGSKRRGSKRRRTRRRTKKSRGRRHKKTRRYRH